MSAAGLRIRTCIFLFQQWFSHWHALPLLVLIICRETALGNCSSAFRKHELLKLFFFWRVVCKKVCILLFELKNEILRIPSGLTPFYQFSSP